MNKKRNIWSKYLFLMLAIVFRMWISILENSDEAKCKNKINSCHCVHWDKGSSMNMIRDFSQEDEETHVGVEYTRAMQQDSIMAMP
jgi:hypothetical protein